MEKDLGNKQMEDNIIWVRRCIQTPEGIPFIVECPRYFIRKGETDEERLEEERFLKSWRECGIKIREISEEMYWKGIL